MGRAHRIEFPGALYHVINRGNNKNAIFLDDMDYNVFLKKLRETKEEFPFYLYAYCLMPNHFHLLLETMDTPLSKIMQVLLSSYALYFNAKYDKVGHLFQSRYKATICQDIRYLFKLFQYIHINPVEANLVKNIDDYKWCSHQYYIGKTENKILSIERLFKIMDVSIKEGFNLYINLLNEKLEIKIKGNIFGTEEFIEKIKNENVKTDKAVEAKPDKKTLSEILDEVTADLRISRDAILSYNRFQDSDYARKIFYYKSAKEYGYKLQEISCFTGRNTTVIDRAIRQIKKGRNGK